MDIIVESTTAAFPRTVEVRTPEDDHDHRPNFWSRPCFDFLILLFLSFAAKGGLFRTIQALAASCLMDMFGACSSSAASEWRHTQLRTKLPVGLYLGSAQKLRKVGTLQVGVLRSRALQYCLWRIDH
jgi:hypothetical protein